MIEVSDIDFDFLFWLNGLYEAVCVSVHDPVVVSSDTYVKKVGPMTHMFYDVAEEEDSALAQVRWRIENAGDDIREHLRLHETMLQRLFDIVGSSSRNDRNGIVTVTRTLCEQVGQYAELVRTHQEAFDGKAFLHYPTCMPGHYFHVRGSKRDVISEKMFNKDQSYEALNSDLNLIRTYAGFFREGKGRAPQIVLIHRQEDLDAVALSDVTSLDDGLSTTRELLERAGMEL